MLSEQCSQWASSSASKIPKGSSFSTLYHYLLSSKWNWTLISPHTHALPCSDRDGLLSVSEFSAMMQDIDMPGEKRIEEKRREDDVTRVRNSIIDSEQLVIFCTVSLSFRLFSPPYLRSPSTGANSTAITSVSRPSLSDDEEDAVFTKHRSGSDSELFKKVSFFCLTAQYCYLLLFTALIWRLIASKRSFSLPSLYANSSPLLTILFNFSIYLSLNMLLN